MGLFRKKKQRKKLYFWSVQVKLKGVEGYTETHYFEYGKRMNAVKHARAIVKPRKARYFEVTDKDRDGQLKHTIIEPERVYGIKVRRDYRWVDDE